MPLKKPVARHALLWALCIVLLAALGSCGYSLQEQLSGPFLVFPRKNTIHAHAQCVLTKEFKARQLHLNVDNTVLGIVCYDLDIGESMAENAEKMARSVFSEVTVTDLPGKRGNIDVIIIPNIHYIGTLMLEGNSAGTTMEMEWTILNKNDEVIDRIIVQGEGHGERVLRMNYFEANQEVLRIVGEDIIKDIFSRSLSKFYLNPELSKLGNRKK